MREMKLFEAMSNIQDDYISSAMDFLGYEQEETHRMKTLQMKKITRTALIAAALTTMFTISAVAAYIGISHRIPNATETFHFKWEENATDYVEWDNVKLAVSFPETAESQKIVFRPGWLPFPLPSALALSDPAENITDETFFRRFTAESMEHSDDMSQPLQISTDSMAQFNENGAMLLLYQTPGNITEEHWEEQGVDVLRFSATHHRDGVSEMGIPASDTVFNYVIMANADEGWVVVVDGELDMDTMIRVAKQLQIQKTGETATYKDFIAHYVMLDGGVG